MSYGHFQHMCVVQLSTYIFDKRKIKCTMQLELLRMIGAVYCLLVYYCSSMNSAIILLIKTPNQQY